MNPKQEGSSKRKKWSVEEKINILRSHFSKAKLLETCEEFRVHPNMVSNWFKTVLEAGAEILSGRSKSQISKLEKQVTDYEKELSRKNEIIAELSLEILSFKKKRNG